MSPALLATAVGNYPRICDPPGPARLRQAGAKLDRGEIGLAEFAEVEAEVTREVIHEQIDAGLDLVTDGMIRWDDGQTYLARELLGFDIGGLVRYLDTNTYYRQPVVTGRVRWERPITVDDLVFARKVSSRPVKPTLPGPLTMAALSRDEFYRDREALVMDLARAIGHEVRALARAGAPLVQIDEPWLARVRGESALLGKAWRMLSEAADVPLSLYTWFGDVNEYWPVIRELPLALVGLDLVAGPAGWEIVEGGGLPFGIGAGVVDGRNTRLEAEADVVATVLRAARATGPHPLHVNPSTGLEYLPRERAREKLALVGRAVRAARESLS